MQAKELIGKMVIRTKAVELGNGRHDWSYCSGKPVKIINATDTNVVIESSLGKSILDARFLNDWTCAETLMKSPN